MDRHEEGANKRPRNTKYSNSEGYTCILLFPKEFEMNRFLVEAEKQGHRINNSLLDDRRCVLLTLIIGGIQENYYTLCMGDSDIAFSFRLGKLLQEWADHKLHIVLCGTCGGSHALKHKRGKVFRVNRAVKIDRGLLNIMSIDSKDGKKEIVAMQFNKSAESFCSDHTMVSSGVTTICSNHVLNLDPVTLKKHGLACPGAIVDMETHEFFKTCELNNVPKYDCLRVVSDVTDPAHNTQSPEFVYEYNRFNRKKISFAKLVGSLVDLSLESIVARREKPVEPPTEAQRRDSDNLVKNLKEILKTNESNDKSRYDEAMKKLSPGVLYPIPAENEDIDDSKDSDDSKETVQLL